MGALGLRVCVHLNQGSWEPTLENPGSGPMEDEREGHPKPH